MKKRNLFFSLAIVLLLVGQISLVGSLARATSGIPADDGNGGGGGTGGITVTYNGDGTYNFSQGQRVKLDNSLIIEPVYSHTGDFNNISFKVYSGSGAYLGQTDITRGGWHNNPYSFDNRSFTASVVSLTISGTTWSSTITLASYYAAVRPDLKITALTDRTNPYLEPIPSTINAGTSIGISAKIENVGVASSEPTTVRIVVDDLLIATSSVESIAAGGSAWSSTASNWIPSVGSHTLRVDVDPSNTINESDETNNLYTQVINVVGSTQPADLQATYIKTSPDVPFFAANTGGYIGIYGYWKNNSAQPFAGKFFYSCYLDGKLIGTDGKITTSTSTERSYDYSSKPLAAGASDRVVCDLLDNLSVGTYQLKVVIDSTNLITESNENNNSETYSLHIGSSSETSDLKINDLTATGITFQSAVVKWRTNVVTSGMVYYQRITSNVMASVSTASTSTSDWLVAKDDHSRTNHEVVLRNLFSNTKYRYYVVSATESGQETRSETEDFATRGLGSDDKQVEHPKSDDTIPVIQPVPKVPPVSEEIRTLRERIKKLELHITELENQLIQREKSLAQPTDQKLTDRVKGKILLQVEDNGEAWYIDPITGKKYYFKDGASAYQAMQAFGLGISNEDLAKIPVGTDPRVIDQDTDHDGLSDITELAIGTDPNNPDSDGDGFADAEELKNNYSPLGPAKISTDPNLEARLKGRIVIQTENKGQAWYINPADGKRYFLGNGSQAYKIMRYLSTGATNNDLRKISVGDLSTGQ